MRNPGESSEARVQMETPSEACAKGSDRDECDSPPCKRLKQGVLSFPTLPSSPLTSTGSFKTSVSTTSDAISVNSQNKPSEPCQEKPQASGGLVTGAPSPPDVKESSVKPKNYTDLSKVSKNLGLENKENTPSEQRDASSISSPESNSSSREDELMVIDQSPPAQENRMNPILKSAEKLKRKEEREKERQEKQRLKEEKLKEKEEAKAAKEKERLEAKRKRDQERQEKQAEREKREKEKIEKREKEEKERLEKKEKREEERRKREEEKNAKVEEKRKREAEKRNQEEEQARKRQKLQDNFASFFTKTSTLAPKTSMDTGSRFKPFEPTTGMSIAPATRKQLSLETKKLLDEGLRLQECYKSYLRELEARKPIPKYTKRKLSTIEEQSECDSDDKTSEGPTDIDENSNSSVEIVEKKNDTSSSVGLRYKLLQFHKNYRPAYYGTHQKKSRYISPRNPFKKDMELLDYEVDSDEEWEEEEPGESLSNSEGEDEGDGDDDNEDNDGFFVPHGYLSDDEGVGDGDDDEYGENEENEGENPENRRDQQLAKAKAWEAEMKRKCKPMKPVTLGCLWLEDAALNVMLKQFAACLLVDGPISIENLSSTSNRSADVDTSSGNTSGALYVPDEAMPDLIKLVHGNTGGLNKLMIKFRKQWTSKCLGRDVTDEEVDEKSPISKRQIEKKIQNIASKEKRNGRSRWYVHSHILEAFGLQNLLVVNGCNSSDASTETTKSSAALLTNTPSIIHFTRPVSPVPTRGASPELKKNTLKINPASTPCSSTSPMEIDNKGSSGCDDISSCSNGANSHLKIDSESQSKSTSQVWNNTESSIITPILTGSKTNSNTENNSTGNVVETVCID